MDKSNFTHKKQHELVKQVLFKEVRDILVNQAALNRPISYGKLCAKISTRNMKPTDKALEEVFGEISASEDKLGRGMLSVFVGNKWENYMQVIAEKPATASNKCYTSGCKFRQ